MVNYCEVVTIQTTLDVGYEGNDKYIILKDKIVNIGKSHIFVSLLLFSTLCVVLLLIKIEVTVLRFIFEFRCVFIHKVYWF